MRRAAASAPIAVEIAAAPKLIMAGLERTLVESR